MRLCLVMGSVVLALAAWVGIGRTERRVAAAKGVNLPEYTKDGSMITPKNYREWVYLTSGFDMTYRERAGAPDHSMFDNVFVNPEAYQSFLATGTWPDKTIMVLESRGAESKGEVIVKGGRFQGAEVTGLEVHVKDSARFNRGGAAGSWGFFDLQDGKGKVFEPGASCYTCHEQHAAVDTTFVQFYPTLVKIAEAKGRLSKEYLKEKAGVGK